MSTKQLTVLSVSTAIQVVLMLICLLLPTVKISMLFVASLLNGLLCSAGYKKGYVIISFIATLSLSFILISNYIIPAAYALFFGGYGIVHFASVGKKIVVKQIIRFAYLAIGLGIIYLLFKALFLESILFAAPYIYFVPVGVILGYLLYQWVYDMVIREFYRHKYIKNLIVK